MPIFASILSVYILGERLYLSILIGLTIGIADLFALIGPVLFVLQKAPIGVFLIVGPAISWTVRIVLYRKFSWSAPTTTIIGWQLLAGAMPISAYAVLYEPFPQITEISSVVWAALACVVFVPMVFGQPAYYKIVNMLPASVAAISTLAIAAVGVVSSAIISSEPISHREIAARALISMALAVVLFAPTCRAR